MSDNGVARFQEILGGVALSGYVEFEAAHVIFKNRPWPEDSYFDFVIGAYYIPITEKQT